MPATISRFPWSAVAGGIASSASRRARARGRGSSKSSESGSRGVVMGVRVETRGTSAARAWRRG